MKKWYLYVLLCCDGSFYVGITTNILKRMKDHRDGKGSKYVRSKGSFNLIYHQYAGSSRSEATKLELEWKKLNHWEKMERMEEILMSGGLDEV